MLVVCCGVLWCVVLGVVYVMDFVCGVECGAQCWVGQCHHPHTNLCPAMETSSEGNFDGRDVTAHSLKTTRHLERSGGPRSTQDLNPGPKTWKAGAPGELHSRHRSLVAAHTQGIKHPYVLKSLSSSTKPTKSTPRT